MGFILSKLRRTPDSPGTKLEAVNKAIEQIESFKRHNQQLQKKVVASLVIYSILFYLVAAILFFVYYFPVLSLRDKLVYSAPLLVFPALIFGIKKFLHCYFVKRITDNDLKLSDLKDEKNKIIDDVMENETYKKATDILQKYAPNRLHKLNESKDNSLSGSTPLSHHPRVVHSPPNTELRQRVNVAQSPASPQARSTMLMAPTPGPQSMNRSMAPTPAFNNKVTTQQRHLYGAPPGPPLPRQVLPRDRSYVDKMFEYLVGDGPQNRYALICKYCFSHNGMALPEEFEYLSFRCCYCFGVNEARKQRPNAPRLNLDTTIGSASEDELSAAGDDDETDDGVDGENGVDTVDEDAESDGDGEAIAGQSTVEANQDKTAVERKPSKQLG